MAANKDMQMKKYDLLCLLREDKAFEIEGVRKHCEMKLADSISKSKAWNPILERQEWKGFIDGIVDSQTYY